MNDDRSATERLVTVPEAAENLGISPEAVRARLSRGTLAKEKGPDGTTYVRLSDDRTHSNDDSAHDRTEPDSVAFQLMRDQIDYLRGQLEVWQEEARRKDHIIAALTERIPELEAPPEARESPDTASEGADGREPSEPVSQRSWWRRMFGR